MSEVQGNTKGLKPHQTKLLERLYQRRVKRDALVSPELALSLAEVSHDTGRQVGVLVDRKGAVIMVIVGDAKGIMIAELGRFRVGQSRFRGVRFLHTHLDNEPLTQDDLTDLTLLRFDAIACLECQNDGTVGEICVAWLVPTRPNQHPWHIEPPRRLHELNLNFYELITGLEQEFATRASAAKAVHGTTRRGILVGVTKGRLDSLKQSLSELAELANSAGIEIVDVIAQRRQTIDSKFVVGSGKLRELMITAVQQDAGLIIFEGELSGSQMRAISELSELDVIDRTQLILDIFAKRAHSRDGKLQVELAQLKYSLPRLVLKDDFLSRITGGIGAKGPGETKIEVLRRRVKTRLANLERELDNISKQRRLRRARRSRSGLAVVNLVGYTNAGKSTILRTLTGADILVEERMFATLDPTSRRLRLPSGREVILIDTVGFIQDLPQDLARAFRATLEELQDADVLVHVVDAASSGYQQRAAAVTEILEDLALDYIPQLLLLNKCDQAEPKQLEEYTNTWPSAICVSALQRQGLTPFLQALDDMLDSAAIAAKNPSQGDSAYEMPQDTEYQN